MGHGIKKKKLKVIRGNFKKVKASNLPSMPRGLPVEVKRAWKRLLRLADHDVLLPCDVIALELAAYALAGREALKRSYYDKNESKEYMECLKIQDEMVFQSLGQFFLSPKSRIENQE